MYYCFVCSGGLQHVPMQFLRFIHHMLLTGKGHYPLGTAVFTKPWEVMLILLMKREPPCLEASQRCAKQDLET